MEILNTAVSAGVIAAVGLILSLQFRGQIRDLRREMDRRFDAVDRRFEGIEAGLSGLRSDLTRVALAVGAGPSREAGASPRS